MRKKKSELDTLTIPLFKAVRQWPPPQPPPPGREDRAQQLQKLIQQWRQNKHHRHQ
jgi:hypothetical protein